MATTVTTSSYTPESRTYTYTEQYTLPTGSAPQPLPTSRTYVRPVKQHKGIGAGIKDAFHRASGKAQRTWNEATDERFRRYFSFPYDEQLFGEWWGDVWSGGELIPCSVYVSNNYLCILYKRKNPTTKDKVHIRATIALRDITFLQRACCLPAATGHTPVIQPINDPSIKADSIIVYTNDGKMHQFCKFFNFDTFITTLEYNWKTVKAGTNIGSTSQYVAPTGSSVSNPTLVKQTTTTTTAVDPTPITQTR